MNSDPFIIVRDSKPLSVHKSFQKISKFTQAYSNDAETSLMSKDKRLSRPSDDVVEKLKSMVASMEQDSLTNSALVEPADVDSMKKRQAGKSDMKTNRPKKKRH
jgi:hypothetical protein